MKIGPTFRQRVLAGEFLAGTWLNLGSAITAEMAGLSGYDWVLLDHEHGPGCDSTMAAQLQAVSGTPAAGLVRIPGNDPVRIKRALDIGAHGIMIPYVGTAEEARLAVQAMRYPPRGARGVAKLTRATGFGFDFDAYFAWAHEWLVTLPQIETPEGVANARAIAAIDGVDVVFVGPMDLSTALGVPGEYEHPRCLAALREVAAAARAAGKAAGILLLNPRHVGMCQDIGYSFVALGSDGGGAAAGLRDNHAHLRAKQR